MGADLFLAVAIKFTNICENNGDHWHVGCHRTGCNNVTCGNYIP